MPWLHANASNAAMRRILIAWLFEVAAAAGLHARAVFNAVSILDAWEAHHAIREPGSFHKRF